MGQSSGADEEIDKGDNVAPHGLLPIQSASEFRDLEGISKDWQIRDQATQKYFAPFRARGRFGTVDAVDKFSYSNCSESNIFFSSQHSDPAEQL